VGLLKIFAKVGKILKEDNLISANGSGSGSMTPATAQAEMSKVYGDFNHPYYVKEHPGHKAAVEEMARLASFAYPAKK
jgi:hypothetical protein